jgi:hypothetical protein
VDTVTYQEMLRTLGTLLDECGGSTAVIKVSRQGAEVVAPGWRWDREWTMVEVTAASTEQRAWREKGSVEHRRINTTQLRWRLRLVGAELDAAGGRPYLLTVQPDTVRVQGPNGYDRQFPTASIERRAKLAPYLRGQQPLV